MSSIQSGSTMTKGSSITHLMVNLVVAASAQTHEIVIGMLATF